MLIKEIIIVTIIAILGIVSGIVLFIGSQKNKLKKIEVFSMIIVGLVSAVFSWTFLENGIDTKEIVQNVLGITLSATVLTKLIINVINAAINIPEKKIQKILIDWARKKVGLNEEDKTTNDYYDETVDDNVSDNTDNNDNNNS